MKRILLISNRVMHYRVSVYNYFHKRFKEHGCDFVVMSNEIQRKNCAAPLFDFKKIDFSLGECTREIKKLNPDLVILFMHLKERLYWMMVHWLKLKRIPFVYWNKAVNYDDIDNRIKRSLFKYMHNIADAIILYSDYEKKYIDRKNWWKTYAANNTVNFDDFPRIRETKQEIKRQLNIPFEKVVLFTGRMDIGGGRKKVDHLIRIFNEMHDPEIGLVIVGSGLCGAPKKMIQDRNILYLGEVHDPQNIQISKIFKMADVFCIPGHIGLGINQAMYWGLPVVTENGGQPPEVNYLINGVTGYLVENNDVAALKQRIHELLHNREKAMKFGHAARKHIIEVASIEKMFSAFLNCSENIMTLRKAGVRG